MGADNDPYVWTNAAGDIGEVLLYWRWSFLSRELLLSFLTLLNHDKTSVIVAEAATDKPVTCNADCIEGVCYTFWELGSMLVPLIIAKTSRNKYGFVGGGPTDTFWGIAFGGFAVAAAFGYLSILLARAIAGEFPRDSKRYGWLVMRDRLYGPYRFEGGFQSFGKGLETIAAGTGTVLGFVFALATSIGDSPIYTYLFADGDTDDGTYCADSLGAERFSLAGYPAASSSPYVLPWGDDMKQCVQGNMGVWSHYPDASSQQTYAYDYSHDVGTEILASRAGIITQIRDNQPDNNPNNWNFVEVMHLLVNPAGGAAAVPVPAGVAATFADGTAIPAGTLFPPYWVPGNGHAIPGLAHSSAAASFGGDPAGCHRDRPRRPCRCARVLRRPQWLQRGDDVRIHRRGSRSRHRRDCRRRDLLRRHADRSCGWRGRAGDCGSAGARHGGVPRGHDVRVRPEQQSAAVARDVRRIRALHLRLHAGVHGRTQPVAGRRHHADASPVGPR